MAYNDDDDDNGITSYASLITGRTTTYRYRKFWRRILHVCYVFSLNRTPSDQEFSSSQQSSPSPSSSSVDYVSLSPASHEQLHNRSELAIDISLDGEQQPPRDSKSSADCVSLLPTPPPAYPEQLHRTSSNRCELAIDISLDGEQQLPPDSKSWADCVPLLPTPPPASPEQLHRTSWNRSKLAIDISLDGEQQLPRDSKSSADCVSLLPTPPPASPEQLHRTSSNPSGLAIDISLDGEQRLPQDLKSLLRFGGIERVASFLNSDLGSGLEGGRDQQTWNKTDLIRATALFFHYFLKACNRYTIVLLLISAGLSFGVEMKEQGPGHGWHDGVAILVALFLLVTFLSVANFIRAIKLRKKKNKLKVEVVRSSSPLIVTASEIRKGDIVILKKGNRVPADGLFVNGKSFKLDEVFNSKCTTPFLYYGSTVTEGDGKMLVTSVGDNRALSKVQSLMTRKASDRTFLEARIEKSNSYIENLVLSISALISTVILIGLLCKRQRENDDVLPELKGKSSIEVFMKIFKSMFLRPRGRVRILAGALTAIVLSIQHGMPLAIVVSLSYWNSKVESEDQMKSQNLSACGTMGLVQVMCMNAGLICNEVEVNRVFIGEKEVNNDVEFVTSQAVVEALHRGITASTRVLAFSSSPTNDSLIFDWAVSTWEVFSDECFSVHDYDRLSSDNAGFWVLLRENGDGEATFHLHMQGAASKILNQCSHYFDSRGEIRAIEDQKANFERVVKEMEEGGLTAFAFAFKKSNISNVTEDGMHLLAILGLKYLCNEQIKSTVKALRDAGVSIKIVSRDDVSVTRAIAYDTGIVDHSSNNEGLNGEQFLKLNDEERMEKIEQVNVIGGCQSEHMLCIIQSLQKSGHVVGFYGGLTMNDIPALEEADVGITKKAQSTEMAKEICHIVIQNEDSLHEILKRGRCAYYNIRKFTQLQLTSCISGLLINLVAAMCSWDSPLTAIQLVYVNFVWCFLGGIMMVMDLRIQGSLSNLLAKRTEPLITKLIWKDILIQALYQASVLLILHLVGPDMNEDVWKCLVFNAFLLCQLFNQFNAMDLLRQEMVSVLRKNYCFSIAVAAVLVLQVILVEFERSFGHCRGLKAQWWAISFIVAVLPWCFRHVVRMNLCCSLSDWFLRENGYSRNRRFSPFFGIPFFIFFVFSLSYYFTPNSANAFSW